MKIDRNVIGAGLIALVLLFVGAGLMEEQSVVPGLEFNDISSPSKCGPWSVPFVDCYTGSSGKRHCYYALYYDGDKEKGFMYTDSTYTSAHGDKTLKLIGAGQGIAGWTYQCAVKCYPPVLTWGNATISDTGLAQMKLNMGGGGNEVAQSIDFSATQIYAYDGIQWTDISSQLDPTELYDQTTTFKWQLIEDETGSMKVKLANSCGYILDWDESNEVTFTPDDDPCDAVPCDDYCDTVRHIKYEDGACSDGDCEYSTIEMNSTECGYIPDDEPDDDSGYEILTIGSVSAVLLLSGLYIYKRRQ